MIKYRTTLGALLTWWLTLAIGTQLCIFIGKYLKFLNAFEKDIIYAPAFIVCYFVCGFLVVRIENLFDSKLNITKKQVIKTHAGIALNIIFSLSLAIVTTLLAENIIEEQHVKYYGLYYVPGGLEILVLVLSFCTFYEILSFIVVWVEKKFLKRK